MRRDVAILGAGPAGLTAATLLARDGARVVLLDRRRSGAARSGETLAGAAARLLRRLDLPFEAERDGHCRLAGLDSYWAGRAARIDHLASPDGPSWLIGRGAFEASLARAAAAAGVATAAAGASAPERADGRWRLGAGIEADLLIDATGRPAAAARRLGARFAETDERLAVWTIVEACDARALARPLIESAAAGWWFAVALRGGAAYVAFHAAPAEALALAHSREAWAAKLAGAPRLCARLPASLPDSVRSVAPAGGRRLDRFAGEGWIACGDAALAFDPIASQGLFSAIAGGEMAARAAAGGDSVRAYGERLADIWDIYEARRRALYRLAAEEEAATLVPPRGYHGATV